MTYAITQTCCNDATCVAVCPVNCIHPTPDEPDFGTTEMLYIDPRSCIDCGACADACPAHRTHDRAPRRTEHSALGDVSPARTGGPHASNDDSDRTADSASRCTSEPVGRPSNARWIMSMADLICISEFA